MSTLTLKSLPLWLLIIKIIELKVLTFTSIFLLRRILSNQTGYFILNFGYRLYALFKRNLWSFSHSHYLIFNNLVFHENLSSVGKWSYFQTLSFLRGIICLRSSRRFLHSVHMNSIIKKLTYFCSFSQDRSILKEI